MTSFIHLKITNPMASLPWFRMYSEAAGDPVLQSLSFDDQRHYFILLCLKCNGTIDRRIAPQHKDRIIARGLGLDQIAASEAKRRMMEVALIDKNWHPTGWEKRQYQSDKSTDRVRKHRNTKVLGNVSDILGNVSETSVTISDSVSVSVSVSDSDINTSKFIFDLILTLSHSYREPNFNAWANDIRLMRERDGRTDAEIRALFEWSNSHHFWKTNILSPSTLRKQWDKLVIQRDNAGDQNGKNQYIDNSAPARVDRAIAERKRREQQQRGDAERVFDLLPRSIMEKDD